MKQAAKKNVVAVAKTRNMNMKRDFTYIPKF